MQQLLKGEHAIVTGGTAGIGKAIAIKFAEEGAHVAIFGTNVERGALVVKEIQKKTGRECARFYQVDVSNTTAVQEAAAKVMEEFGKVDILVNNAGITRDQLLMRLSEQDWDDVMAINVKSCYNTSHALVRHMMRAKKGKIINMSSVVGLTGNAGQVNYAASKAAVIGFTKSLAKELAGRNICVNCIAPGFIDTRMTGDMTEAQKENIMGQIPFGRMGSSEEVADAALFLASSLSNYVTGQTLSVDGGMAM